MRPRSCTRLLASILVLGLLASVVAAAHAPKTSRAQRRSIAQKQLKQANRLRADLEGTPARKRKESDYRKTTRLYQRVYDIAPFSGLAADALAAKAEMQHDMGKQFNSKYWLEAIKTYQFLRKEYPHSKYADDALFNIAQIKQVHLGQKKSALKDYKHFCSAYPKSRYFARARDRIRTIEKQLAAAAKPKRARPKKPPVAPSEAVEVRNIRYWNTNDFTRVVVDLEGKVKYQGARIKNPDRIFFDLFNTKLSTVLTGKSFNVDDGLLARIRVAENRDSVTRVVLEVSGAADYAVFSLPDPFRLVIDVRGPEIVRAVRKPPAQPKASGAGSSKPAASTATASAKPPEPLEPPKPTRNGEITIARAIGLKVERIVIDPGHGGHDTGTVGRKGLLEKDLVLDVARRLGKLLKDKLNAEVVYTREDDTFVPLENRTAIANQKKADLFLSIHANSSPSRKVRGVETFYLNFTSDPAALELAARENAVSQKSMHELQDLVRKISRNDKIAESRELAQEIQNHLHGALYKKSRRVRNRGVRKAPFVVLIGANMPSVLAEVGFLSNTEDEKLMKSPKGRQQVAEALLQGMTTYLKNLTGTAVARTTQQAQAAQE